MPDFESDGLTLHYQARGNGPGLVLLLEAFAHPTFKTAVFQFRDEVAPT